MPNLYGLSFPELDAREYMPLEAVVLIKGMSKDGKIRYKEIVTPGIGMMECYGMAMSASDTFREILMKNVQSE